MYFKHFVLVTIIGTVSSLMLMTYLIIKYCACCNDENNLRRKSFVNFISQFHIMQSKKERDSSVFYDSDGEGETRPGRQVQSQNGTETEPKNTTREVETSNFSETVSQTESVSPLTEQPVQYSNNPDFLVENENSKKSGSVKNKRKYLRKNRKYSLANYKKINEKEMDKENPTGQQVELPVDPSSRQNNDGLDFNLHFSALASAKKQAAKSVSAIIGKKQKQKQTKGQKSGLVNSSSNGHNPAARHSISSTKYILNRKSYTANQTENFKTISSADRKSITTLYQAWGQTTNQLGHRHSLNPLTMNFGSLSDLKTDISNCGSREF